MASCIDNLTGLYNKSGFYKAAAQLLGQNAEEGFCLLYWNIRQLKVINDMFGHSAGSRILIEFGETLQKEFGGDLSACGRIEQDRFLCLVPARRLADGAWESVSVIRYIAGGAEYHFFACCGAYRIENRELPLEMMADKALVAMECARDSYLKPCVWFDESMWDAIVEEQQLNMDFATAIREKQFEVYYQPICRAADGMVTGAEALIRWNHPQRGLLVPARFVPQFERNGLISALDRYVWEEVCATVGKRLAAGEQTVPVALNVSKAEFYDASSFEDLYATVCRHGVPPDYLRIEITESSYAADPAPVQRAITKLHAFGFKVLMDDFGSGESSLGMLKDYPVDVLKVDRTFLSDIGANPKARVILESVVGMAKRLDLLVVAEGVETRAQWDYMREIGCDLVQGYYFYKPMPAPQFIALMERATPAADPLLDRDSPRVLPAEKRNIS